MNPNNPKLNEITPREMSSQDIERWLRSVQADLEEPGVFVPEMNAIRWDWEDEKNANKPKFAFICPVGYRGMIANLGVNILYEEMNLYRNQICERIYFPYPKLFKRLVQNRIPLFTSESYHQAKDFDVLGISSYYPLQFLGFPQLIKLCGMEPYSKDRAETDPIIMFGGVAAFNPAPVADFVDVVNLGDGEKVLADAVDLIKKLKDEGKSKHEILVELQKQIPGTYVPCLYKEEYYPADDPKHPNQFKAHVPLRDDIPTRIKKYTCEIKDIRPVSKIIQPNSLGDDMSSGAVEITRGCFAAGTLITTDKGLVPIEQVTRGTKVLSYDAEGKPCFIESEGAVQTRIADVYKYTSNSDSVQCTQDHKFLMEDGSWKTAQDVLKGTTSMFLPSNNEYKFDQEAFLVSLFASDVCMTEKALAGGARPIKFEQKATRPGVQYLESLGWHNTAYTRREGMRILNFYSSSEGYKFCKRIFGEYVCSSDKNPQFEVTVDNAASIIFGCMAGDRTTRKNPSQFVLSSQSEKLALFYGRALDALGIRYKWMELKDANRKSPRYCCRVQYHRDLLRLKDIAEQFSSIMACDVDWSFMKESAPHSPSTKFRKAEFVGSKPVYDMTVPGTHCYVANGFVVHNCGHKSFVKGTLISTDRGQVAIEQVTADDKVLCNSITEGKVYRSQRGAFCTGVKKVNKYKIRETGTEFICTPDHRFALADFDGSESSSSYLEAELCAELDKILYDGTHLELVEKLSEQEVWDIETDEHNFYANGVLVHNCSFCEGSYRSMPYRERDLEDIYKAIDQTLLDSGSASLTPYAFNLSDHHRIFDILSYAMTKWPTRIGMSSQHINHFSEQMADMALMTGTRSITIALESADPVMRRRIGKTLSDETVEEKLRLIIRKGFTNIKVYMISNLPYEDDESLHEIENFSRKLIRWQIEEQSPIFPSKEAAHEYVSRPEFDEEIDKFAESCKQAFRSKTKIVPEGEEYWNLHLKYKLITRIKFSYTSFNGKAHTPMQWAQVLPIDEEGFPSIRRDMHTIFDVIQACGHSFRMSGDLEISTLNQVLSYADRRFAPVLVDICNDDRFNYKGTLVAGSNNTMRDFADVMAKHGFDFNFFYREKELDEAFPWDFINMGVTKKFLEKRWLMYKNAEDDIRCQEQCTHCGGCTKVSRDLFKRYWEEGLEEKKAQYKVTPILKRENVCKVRFRFRIRPEYRWLYAFNKKNWLRRSFYRAGIPIKTVFALVSDGVEFNNFCYGTDYGEVWCYSKNFPKTDLTKLLNDTFDEKEPPIIFEEVTVGTSTSQFRTDVGKISYSVQIPSKTYTKAKLEDLIIRCNKSESVIIRQKVASTVERDSTETISIDIKGRFYNLFCVSGDGFSTIYFQMDYGLNPYSFLTTLLATSLSRCRRYPIMVHDVFAKEHEDSFDMFAEICEDCGEVIERNIFDEPVNEHYCSKCAILHDKQELVVNLDADDDDVDDTDLDNFDTSFLEEEDMEEMNEEHQAID